MNGKFGGQPLFEKVQAKIEANLMILPHGFVEVFMEKKAQLKLLSSARCAVCKVQDNLGELGLWSGELEVE